MEQGFTKNAACGILGNMQQESGMTNFETVRDQAVCGKTCVLFKRIFVFIIGMVLLCFLGACAFKGEDAEDADAAFEADGVQLPSGVDMGEGQLDSIPEGSSDNISEGQSNNVSDERSDSISKEQSDSISAGQDEEMPFSVEESYRAILLGDGAFISADLQNRELSLANIGEAVTDDDSVRVKASQFAIVDLNGDGENEIVLWIKINDNLDYGFEILYGRDKEIYGYTLSYREFMDLKADGTFLYSGGAYDTGIGRLQLSGNGYTIEELCRSTSQYDSDNVLTVQYFENGEPCSEEEFDNALLRQEEKTDVAWYELTEENVGLAFENGF